MANNPIMQFIGISGIPLVKPGEEISSLIINRCQKLNIELQDDDVVVITQKIISKSENRIRDLNMIIPGLTARFYGLITQKDPRFVQLVLLESKSVLRAKKNTLIVEHKNGFVCANAGIDHSNVETDLSKPGDYFLLLPENADDSATRIRGQLEKYYNARLGVLIIDSHGRAWRNGTTGMTIGLSGLPGLVDLRGQEDLFGFKLKITMVAAADELAAGASLLMGQAKEGIPVVVVRGFPYQLREGNLNELIRPKQNDLFR